MEKMTDEQVAKGYIDWTSVVRYGIKDTEEYKLARQKQSEFAAELDRRGLEL
jgi:hypothetical protein